MKNIIKIVFFLSCFLLVGCSGTLNMRWKQYRAQRELATIERAIQTKDKDLLWRTTQRSSDIHYIFKLDDTVIFWSSNVLTARTLEVADYDEWYDLEMSNAVCRCLWRHIGEYDVFVAIPMRWTINAREELEKSFSYRPLLPKEQDRQLERLKIRSRAHAYSLVFAILIGGILFVILFGAVRARGFRTLSLRWKILDTILIIVAIGFAATAFLSTQYIRRQTIDRQEHMFMRKCGDVRHALEVPLQHVYSIHMVDVSEMAYWLDILSHELQTDIHIYDLDGRLVTSSTPQLFDHRVLSNYLAPEVMYSPAEEWLCRHDLGNLQYTSANMPLFGEEHMQIGYLSLPFFVSDDMMLGEVEQFLSRLLPIYLIILLLAILLAIWLTNAISAPFKQLEGQMHELALTSEQKAKHERESAWRTMARQIAHEINNPLTPMKLAIQQLQRVKGSDRFDELFDRSAPMLVEQIDNLSRIASSFSAFAQMPQVEVSTIDVAQKLSDVIALFENNDRQIPIRYIGPDHGVEVYADKNQIGQVFTNLIKNALQALQDKVEGDIIIVLKQLDKEVEISVSDNGCGIPDDLQEKIFAPYFTTKTTGSGLGLAISKHIVECVGGRISFQTSSQGTTFYVYLKSK